jgi:putative nucleotidyltransferase with HDIG domain
MDSKEQAILKQIEDSVLDAIARDSLVLPTLPTVVARALLLLRKREFSFQGVAEVISPDPLVAARVIRLVNSAAMATREPAATILQAVSRLGAAGLHGFLVEISARAVFDSHDKRISKASRGMWEHSLAVAILTRDLGIALRLKDPEVGYLAGLFHDIGKPIVAVMLLDAEKRMVGKSTQSWMGVDTWVALVNRTHRTVGKALAVKWNLPEATQRAVEHWGNYDEADPQSMPNIVRLANAVVKKKGLYVGPVVAAENDEVVAKGAALVGMEGSSLDLLSEALPELVRERLSV